MSLFYRSRDIPVLTKEDLNDASKALANKKKVFISAQKLLETFRKDWIKSGGTLSDNLYKAVASYNSQNKGAYNQKDMTLFDAIDKAHSQTLGQAIDNTNYRISKQIPEAEKKLDSISDYSDEASNITTIKRFANKASALITKKEWDNNDANSYDVLAEAYDLDAEITILGNQNNKVEGVDKAKTELKELLSFFDTTLKTKDIQYLLYYGDLGGFTVRERKDNALDFTREAKEYINLDERDMPTIKQK